MKHWSYTNSRLFFLKSGGSEEKVYFPGALTYKLSRVFYNRIYERSVVVATAVEIFFAVTAWGER